ncbi:hypothetical protein QBC47DRAFT_429165 [Echria macrotheca]|uniref:Uncharacterized protein n=1 Tax=Echria macrotheca TaxID=438768 RepID=A0AAJ0BNI2_9PEZI|nr:hypothetical protein QBC47DRAFT_429165 [Echria macrotheca]
MLQRRIWGVLVSLLAPLATAANTIERDVAIIGGGASGSYAAIRLREDYNLSVVVIEKATMLGGHVSTWVDEAGRGYEAGVQNYIDIGYAKEFFARMGVETGPPVRASVARVDVDFSTGKKLDGSAPPAADVQAALARYEALAEQYLPILEPGWWTFPEPAAIPADLLLPFRNFTAKHNLTAAVPTIFSITGFGVADLLSSPTLWVMRSFGYHMCRVMLRKDTSFVPKSGRNQDLYDKVLESLGSDVLLSSTVLSSVRSRADGPQSGVELQVRDAAGSVKQIKAKRMLFTPALSQANTASFDFDMFEQSVFAALNYSTSYVGIVSHPSLPANTSFFNVPASEPGNSTTVLPTAPFSARFDNYAGTPYYRVIAVGNADMDIDGARKIVKDSFWKITGDLSTHSPLVPLKFHYFKSHGLVSGSATREDLEKGFIQWLNQLQGRWSTWYTGATWGVHLTTDQWVLTDTVLERLVDSLHEGE